MNANPPPGLIIVDLMLPGGQNGFDFIEQVKVHDTWKNTPVFLMTNLAGMDTLAHSLNINEYFEKVNVSLDTVLEKAKQYLQP